MKIAKEFRWEMGHRLPFHAEKCKNLHGHSYKLRLELEGNLDSNGMVLDYYDLKLLVMPLIDQLDHAFVAYKDDKELIEALNMLNSKTFIFETHSTAENLCKYFLKYILSNELPANICKVKVRIYETEESYAEEEAYI